MICRSKEKSFCRRLVILLGNLNVLPHLLLFDDQCARAFVPTVALQMVWYGTAATLMHEPCIIPRLQEETEEYTLYIQQIRIYNTIYSIHIQYKT